MSLRIVSGVLMPKSGHQDSGKVTLTLRENTVLSSDDAIVNYACEFGGQTHYDKEPCKAVSIRAFDGEEHWTRLSLKILSIYQCDSYHSLYRYNYYN